MAEVWPFIVMPEVGERLSWVTSVHERRDDTSRWSLRDARQTWMLRHTFAAARMDEARWLFRSNALGEWDVPVWAYGTRMAVSSGDTDLAVDIPGAFDVDGQAIIWADCDTYTVRTVSGVTDAGITLSASVGATYAAALVMPLHRCITREGLKVTRATREHWEVEAVFEVNTAPAETATTLEPMRVLIAFDASGSMTISLPYSAPRIEVIQSGVIEALNFLEASGESHDIKVTAFNVGSTSLERFACDAADYNDLRAFVAGVTAANNTDWADAFDGASAFFGGDGGTMFFITDGYPEAPPQDGADVVANAVAARDAIPGLTVHAINIVYNMPTHSDLVDSDGQSDMLVLTGGTIYSSIVSGLLSSDGGGGGGGEEDEPPAVTTYNGLVYFPCAGAVVEPVAGRIMQAATYIDSGLGPVRIEPNRSYVEDLGEATVRESGAAGIWAMKQTLLALRGQDAPFWMPVAGHEILASTTTTLTIAAGRTDPADWIGEHIDAGGQQREVVAAAVVSGNHRLTFAAMSAAPTGRMRRLAIMRGRSDEVEIRHHRVARWAETKLTVGTP